MGYVESVISGMRLMNCAVPSSVSQEVAGRPDASMGDLSDDEVVRVALIEAHAAMESMHRRVKELENRLILVTPRMRKRAQ